MESFPINCNHCSLYRIVGTQGIISFLAALAQKTNRLKVVDRQTDRQTAIRAINLSPKYVGKVMYIESRYLSVLFVFVRPSVFRRYYLSRSPSVRLIPSVLLLLLLLLLLSSSSPNSIQNEMYKVTLWMRGSFVSFPFHPFLFLFFTRSNRSTDKRERDFLPFLAYHRNNQGWHSNCSYLPTSLCWLFSWHRRKKTTL